MYSYYQSEFKKINRIDWVDISRGIGILLVIIGHIIQKFSKDYLQNQIFDCIYSFHMPLFFFISGFVMFHNIKYVPDRMWLKNKFIQLVVPYFIWYSIAFYFLQDKTTSFFEHFKNLFYETDLGLWFLWTLFLCSVCFFVALNLCRIVCGLLSENLSEGQMFAGNIIFMLFILLFFGLIQRYIPFGGVNSVFSYFPFVIIGYAVRKKDTSRNIIKDCKMFGCILVCVVFAVLYRYDVIWNALTRFNLIIGSFSKRYCIAIMGIVVVVMISRCIEENSTYIKYALRYIGMHTIEIYILHGWFIRMYFNNRRTISMAFSFLLSIVAPLGISWLISKCKIVHVVLFGR